MIISRNTGVSNNGFCLLATCTTKVIFILWKKLFLLVTLLQINLWGFFNLSRIRGFREKRFFFLSHLNLSCKLYQVLLSHLSMYILCCCEERFSTVACVCVFVWGGGSCLDFEFKIDCVSLYENIWMSNSLVVYPRKMRLTSLFSLTWRILMLLQSRLWGSLFLRLVVAGSAAVVWGVSCTFFLSCFLALAHVQRW